MSTQHWKGMTIPGAGDDLLEAWPNMLDTAGIMGATVTRVVGDLWVIVTPA